MKDSQYCLIDSYYGVTKKESWPLEASEPIQENLERQWMDNFFSQDPLKRIYEFIFDLHTLECYLEKCKQKGIDTRVLYVETCDVDEELKESAYSEEGLMGYELIYSNGFDYSALCDEIDLVEKAGLQKYINKNGLFNCKKAIDQYIEWRKRNITDDEAEPLNEMVIAKVYEMKIF